MPELKILIIAPYPLFPQYAGGKIRIWQLAKHLSQLNTQITIATPYKWKQPFYQKESSDLNVKSIVYPFFIFYHWLENKPFPYQFLMTFHPGYRLLMRKFLNSFDIIQFEHACFADLAHSLPEGKIVMYNAHNVEIDYASSECEGETIKRLLKKRMFIFEKWLIDRSDKVFTCSTNDQKRFQELYNNSDSKYIIIPNGIDWPIDPDAKKAHVSIDPEVYRYPRKALFTGSNVKHNRVAVKFIIENLAPKLKDDCAFIIKGTCAKKFTDSQLDNVFIDPIGGPIAPYTQICSIALSPITQGSGTSLKVIDYLAHRLSVISTAFGMRGLADLKPYVRITGLENFDRIIMEDNKFNPEVFRLLKNYSWRHCAEKMREAYIQVSQAKK